MHAYHGWPFLSVPSHPLLSALWALLAHGVLSLAVVAPLVLRSRRRVRYGLLAFAGGSLIDLDHFVAAGSLSLHAIENLGDRPATHSLVFVALIGLLALALTRRPRLAWSLFAINASHLLFDAAGGRDRILYPLSGIDAVPWLACPIGAAALLLVSYALARRPPLTALPRPRGEERAQTLADLG